MANKPAKLTELLNRCATVPDYRVQPWNGIDDVRIEVRFHVVPGVPVPGQQFGGAAATNEDPDLASPAPGSGVNVADLIPGQVSAQLRRHGFVTGAQMQSGGGSLASSNAASGLRLPGNCETDHLKIASLVTDTDRSVPWDSPASRPTVDSPKADAQAPNPQATGIRRQSNAQTSPSEKNEAIRKSVAQIKKELSEDSST